MLGNCKFWNRSSSGFFLFWILYRINKNKCNFYNLHQKHNWKCFQTINHKSIRFNGIITDYVIMWYGFFSKALHRMESLFLLFCVHWIGFSGVFNYSNKLNVSWKVLDEVKINNQIWLKQKDCSWFFLNGVIIKTIQFLKMSGIGQFLFLVFIYFSICSNLTWLLHLNNCLKSEKNVYVMYMWQFLQGFH